MSLLSKLKGLRTLIVFGIVFVTSALAAVGVVPNPLDMVEANAIADHAETVANAADNLSNVESVSAGVVSAVALLAIGMRLLTKTPVGKK